MFHIHGTEDETVPFKWGSKLYNVTKSKFEPWWVEGAGHVDIIQLHREEYIERMRSFSPSARLRPVRSAFVVACLKRVWKKEMKVH